MTTAKEIGPNAPDVPANLPPATVDTSIAASDADHNKQSPQDRPPSNLVAWLALITSFGTWLIHGLNYKATLEQRAELRALRKQQGEEKLKIAPYFQFDESDVILYFDKGSSRISTVWHVLVTNYGERPVTITNSLGFVLYHKDTGPIDLVIPADPQFSHPPRPLVLQPGIAEYLPTKVFVPFSQEAADVLRKVFTHGTKLKMADVRRAVEQAGIDLQGNAIDSQRESGSGAQHSACFVVHTARGQNFSECTMFDPSRPGLPVRLEILPVPTPK